MYYLNKELVERVIADSEEKRNCEHRQNSAGIDWCYSSNGCGYRNSFVLHAPNQPDGCVNGCEYLTILRTVEKAR